MGAHSGTKRSAPFHDPEWEIWSLAPSNENDIPNHDVWFELHARNVHEPDCRGREYGDWLRGQERLYMHAACPAIPRAIPYPYADMLAAFGRFFFTSSVAWMLALAISREPVRIGLWGVHCQSATEYAHQRPGIRHFIQTARHRGIDVVAPKESRLLEPAELYGFDPTE